MGCSNTDNKHQINPLQFEWYPGQVLYGGGVKYPEALSERGAFSFFYPRSMRNGSASWGNNRLSLLAEEIKTLAYLKGIRKGHTFHA